MDQSRLGIVALVFVVVIAGCSGLGSLQEDDPEDSTETGELASSTTSITQQTVTRPSGGTVTPAGTRTVGEDTTPTDSQETTRPNSGTDQPPDTTQYDVGLDTADIVIRLSDFDGNYDFVSESEIYRSNATGDVLTQLKEAGVQKQHRRLFEVEDRSLDVPQFVISSIAVYDNRTMAVHDLETSIRNLEDARNATVETVQVGDKSVTVVKYKDAQGIYQTIVYYQSSNTVSYILASDDEQYRQNTAVELLKKMVSDYDTTD